MKYIGITGKRGSGRMTFAWLLGKTLQMRSKVTFEEYQKMFSAWTDAVKKSKSVIGCTHFFTLESFGGTILDNIRMTIPSLYNLNLDQESPDLQLPFDMSTLRVCEQSDTTVGEFIIKYADKVLKKNFGQNFWVNIAEQWDEQREQNQFTTEKYTIYWDVKTDAEVEYISKKDGVLINISCPERRRNGGYNTIENKHCDIDLRLHEDFVGDCEQIWKIAQEL